MELNKLRDEIHSNAKDKGFWDKPRETGTLLMLCTSELAEALEADRKGRFAELGVYEEAMKFDDIKKIDEEKYIKHCFEASIKDSFEDELADTMIRILDVCGAKGIDIEKHIKLKMEYNSTRERLHGKKY